jgi:hypothetical protein
MKKFRLLLLDANVVIELFRQGIWTKLIEVCDVHLSRTVVGEAHFFADDDGNRHDFDLGPDMASGKITVFDVFPSELVSFRSHFDPTYLERLDPGEAESLAFLLNSTEKYLICSADKIVFRVLGNLNRPDQGVSLEEVLFGTGLGRSLRHLFTRDYREKWTRIGSQEGLRGMGHQA